MKFDYLMEYIVYDKNQEVLKSGIIKAKNKKSEFEAKAGFGKHIEKVYGENFGSLYIKSCKKDFNIDNIFGEKSGSNNSPNINDIFSQFGDIFGKK
jgi:hypothetical protein